MMMLVRPAATASSITYWMIGLSTSGSISFGWALVAGRKRVPRPAAGKTALRMRAMSDASIGPHARRAQGGGRARRGGGRAAPARVRIPGERGPLVPRRRAARGDRRGRAAAPRAAQGGRGDRAPREEQGRRERAEVGDEGRRRSHPRVGDT